MQRVCQLVDCVLGTGRAAGFLDAADAAEAQSRREGTCVRGLGFKAAQIHPDLGRCFLIAAA